MPATDGLYVFRGLPPQRQQPVAMPPREFAPIGQTDGIFVFRGNPPQPQYQLHNVVQRPKLMQFAPAGSSQFIIVKFTAP